MKFIKDIKEKYYIEILKEIQLELACYNIKIDFKKNKDDCLLLKLYREDKLCHYRYIDEYIEIFLYKEWIYIKWYCKIYNLDINTVLLSEHKFYYIDLNVKYTFIWMIQKILAYKKGKNIKIEEKNYNINLYEDFDSQFK